MGTAWRRFSKLSTGGAPTRRVGLLGSARSGCAASRARSSRSSASYSASDRVGWSST